MPFTMDAFSQTRPYLYHLTAPRNLDRIQRQMRLVSDAKLMEEAHAEQWYRRKRVGHLEVEIDGQSVVIRDQDPLYEGNIALEGGWAFADLIAKLNGLVFFWPGNGNGPVSYGVRHYERYQDHVPVILRFQVADLIAANDGATPLFCKYNSGAPRCNNGQRSPRGPNTFISNDDADFTPGRVVEVVYQDSVVLPAAIELSTQPTGPWRTLAAL